MFTTMDCVPAQTANPVDRFVSCFGTVGEAATAAGVSTEMLRRMRHRGYVTTRDRAMVMAEACKHHVKAAELLAVAKPRQGTA